MQRTVVFRLEGIARINVNDEIGLDAYSSYTIPEHLEDLAGDGRELIASHDNVYIFADHSVMILEQKREHINMDRLDEETKMIILSVAAMHIPAQAERLVRRVC